MRRLTRLELTKPLVFFDLETTGLDTSTAKIVEAYFLKLLPDGQEDELHLLINPGMEIPFQVSKIHGITDSVVADKPKFADVAGQIAAFIGEADLAGFNCIRYDIPLLARELAECGYTLGEEKRAQIDVQVLYHEMEPRNLTAAVEFYLNQRHVDAHQAREDTRALPEILDTQLQKYKGKIPGSVEGLSLFCDKREDDFIDRRGYLRWGRDGEVLLGFGKHRGVKLLDILRQRPDYIQWVLKQPFPTDFMEMLRKAAKEGLFPEPKKKVN